MLTDTLKTLKSFLKKKIIYFGTGTYSDSLSNLLPFEAAYFVDNNPDKWKCNFKGLRVFSPEILLQEDKNECMIIIASQFHEPIAKQLEDMGFESGVHFWNGYTLSEIDNTITQRYEQVNGLFTQLKYAYDGLLTAHNCDFMDDPTFLECFRLGARTGSWGSNPQNYWRAYIYLWVGKKQMKCDGDYVECGVNKGGYARALIHYTDFGKSDKNFYLYDTFEGSLEPHMTEDEKRMVIQGQRHIYQYEPCLPQVLETFRSFNNVVVVPGVVPAVLNSFPVEKRVSFLSIDMNCVTPEIAAAEFFWDRLVPGAIILLDDYGFDGHILQKRAFDKFALERNVEVLSLPTGQGMIFKPSCG